VKKRVVGSSEVMQRIKAVKLLLEMKSKYRYSNRTTVPLLKNYLVVGWVTMKNHDTRFLELLLEDFPVKKSNTATEILKIPLPSPAPLEVLKLPLE